MNREDGIKPQIAIFIAVWGFISFSNDFFIYGSSSFSFALSLNNELSDSKFCSFNEIAKVMYSNKKMFVYITKDSSFAYMLFSLDATLPWKLLHLDAYSMLNNTKVILSSSVKRIVCREGVGVLTSIWVIPFSISSFNFFEKLCTMFLDLFGSLIFKVTLFEVRAVEVME